MPIRALFFLLFLVSLITGCRSRHVAIEQFASIQHSHTADTINTNIEWLILDSLWQLDTVRVDSVSPKLHLHAVRRIKMHKNAESSARSCSMRADSSAYKYEKTSNHNTAFNNDNSVQWLLIKLAVASILVLVLVRKGKKYM